MAEMSSRGQEIAIVGTGCRLPGDVTNPSKLWDLIRSPRQLAEPIPPDRFSLPGFYHQNGQYHGHENVKEAYFLAGDGVYRRFDCSFFGISPAEANTLDPQSRLLLETVYEALEYAGITVEELRGSNTAVFAGQMVADYEQVMLRDTEFMATYHATGTSRALLANRVSYFFDWHGPSMTIDTACSSSLVAVHEAVQQLRSGNSRVAIAAGANLIFDPQCFIAESTLHMLSPDGRSRMWDTGANGYARGEGIAAVVLKTLDDALRDGDHIECIIRETGVNQDGRTPGITMPNAAAQAQLIRECYTRSGLNPFNPDQRPQYFEAHGTGTPAGDPIEAEAISSAFWPPEAGTIDNSGRLLVGSIKTVVGHTEGTAGLAGILKASLALQNSIIPPNLLFERLNPKIMPFYTHLEVPTTASTWPAVCQGNPRRASVNSFGFGGTNAHAILESYEPDQSRGTYKGPVAVPFVFSAASETSLRIYLTDFCNYVAKNAAHLNLYDLAFTLHSRRTRLDVAISVTASTTDDLIAQLNEKLQVAQANSEQTIGIRSSYRNLDANRPSILGIFTGQGAQWAQMGYDLITASSFARRIVTTLEERLSRLPIRDRPSWSLLQELQKDQHTSRINEPSISQPLCTAIQILQVELMRAAGVKFTAVVGHSSGEIAAAYAAGLISSENAICIAYYRGLHAQLAPLGAMMAVGTSTEDAQELCDAPEFQNRACIAAVNSATSVTVAGEQDAIEELKIIFEDEGKFVRTLKVNKAYHTDHMRFCSSAYLNSLEELNIEIRPCNQTLWYSSVHGSIVDDLELLKGRYWDQNMVQPVLFMKAIENAHASHGPFDLAIEIGPHPALKGAALETIGDASDQTIPYTGVFSRNKSSMESIAISLGHVWTHLGKDSVNLQAYNKAISGSSCKLIKGLPAYAWNHDKEYWHESRYARAIRLRPGPVHELLGHVTPNSTKEDIQWRHILRPTEIPWLFGHKLQGQIVFPAAAYIVLAMEASVALCEGIPATLIEVMNVDIGRALTFDDDDSSVEAIFSVTDISRQQKPTPIIYANFKYSVSSKGDSLGIVARGNLRIRLSSQHTDDVLPVRRPRPPNLLKVRASDFYSSLQELEYDYSGPFAALDQIERKLGAVTGYISNLEPSKLLIHPAILDVAFQTALLTHSAPGDGALWSLHVPRRVSVVSVNPNLCLAELTKGDALPFDSTRLQNTGKGVVSADISIYPRDTNHAMIQIEGLECTPFAEATSKDDKELFSTVVWDVLNPDVQLAAPDISSKVKQLDLVGLLERIAGFYLRILDRGVPESHSARMGGPYRPLFHFAAHVIAQSQSGELQQWQPEWEQDTYEQIVTACKPYEDLIDVRLLHAVGRNILQIAQGEESAFEIAMKDNLLGQYYEKGEASGTYHRILARTVKQIAHRYPRMDIMEIGAGTGACTQAIFREVGSLFSSYTFTDISTGLFTLTQTWPSTYLNKMILKPFDVTQDPCAQGFAEHSFDLVVASNVLHATPCLEQTLRNVRRLLKPGGSLIMVEMIPPHPSFFGLMFGVFPGWWLGHGEGRTFSPGLRLDEWDHLLRATGFSGCDSTTPGSDNPLMPLEVIVSQATDDKIAFLRSPLLDGPQPSDSRVIEDLLVLGGNGVQTAGLMTRIKPQLSRYCGRLRTIRSLSDLATCRIESSTTILSLIDLDIAVFQDLDSSKWEAIKGLLVDVGALVWITVGRLADNPYANMMVGLVRSAVREIPTLDYCFLDFEDERQIDEKIIAESVLRHQAATRWRKQDNIHFTAETELVIDARGKTLIPRLVNNREMNDRYNSSRRTILTQLPRYNRNMCIEADGQGWNIANIPMPGQTTEIPRIHVEYSLLSPIRVAQHGCMFVVLGEDSVSGHQVVALSTMNASTILPFAGFSIPVQIEKGSGSGFLKLVVHYILASFILEGLSEGDKIVVHEPDPYFAEVLSSEATSLGVETTFTTHISSTDPLRHDWLQIHKNASESSLFPVFPNNISTFVDFAAEKEVESVISHICSQISPYCRLETRETLFGKNAWKPFGSYAKKVSNRVHWAVIHAQHSLVGANELPPSPSTTTLKGLSELDRELAVDMIIDWTLDTDPPVRVMPIDTQVSFSSNKTYWLVGLSGGLGLSTCDWLIQHGARYVVISSRNPNIDQAWLDEARSLGAVIKIASCDITNRHEVLTLHNDICSTMPPIAGVAQGAMVLEDTPIRNMSLDDLLKVTKPKVQGSVHLNDLFQGDTLDFFIFFSSATSIIGNPGQANYSAANLFMSSLAEQRRRRGLAASIINIGPIFGVGYIAQVTDDSRFRKNTIKSGGYLRTSESDFHQLLAEAVVASRPNPSMPTELVSGIRSVNPQERDQPMWESEPLMSHFVRNQEHIGNAETNSNSTSSFKSRLAEAETEDAIYSIIEDAFRVKVLTLFQLDPLGGVENNLIGMRLDQMGIDSLSAVEIRSWFLKALEVNIPVLKILNGATVGELIAIATEKIPSRLVPSRKVEYSLQEVGSEDTSGRIDDIDTPSTPLSAASTYDEKESLTTDQQSEHMKGSLSPYSQTSSSPRRSFPLSYSQELFWFVWASMEDKTSINHTGLAKVTGRIDVARLQEAAHIVGLQHESLRTSFFEEDGKPMQRVLNQCTLHLEHQVIREDSEASEIAKSLREHVFDVYRGEAMRLLLLSRSETKHFLVFCVHSLAMDGTSFQVFLAELMRYYTYPNLQRNARQALDYFEDQHIQVAAGAFESELQFWKTELAELPPPLPILSLSKLVSRPISTAYANERIMFRIGIDTKRKIQDVCRRYGVTPFHFYLAAFRALLSRYASDAEDISIGIADANRSDDEMMEVIGTFVNLLPIRLRSKSSTKFENLLKDARRKTYDALANSKLPFTALLNELNVPRSATCTPIFQCFVDYRQGQQEKVNWGDTQLQWLDFENPKMPYDVALDIIDSPNDECVHILQVRKDIYGSSGAEWLSKSYKHLVDAFAADPCVSLDTPQIFDPSDSQDALQFSKGPSYNSLWPETVIHRIDQMVQERAHEPAVRQCNQVQHTYQDVSRVASAISIALQATGVTPGSPIAVLQEPTAHWISSILGIFRVGAVYLPLDLNLPWRRLQDMVKNCQAPVILVDEHTRQYARKLGFSDIRTIDVSALLPTDVEIPIEATPDGLAAIMYTSGSSGTPKGIMLKHQGLKTWTEDILQLCDLGAERVLQQTSPTFDMSLLQILLPLCNGGSISLVPRQARGDACAISKLMAEHEITLTGGTPSEYSSWMNYGKRELLLCTKWRTAISGGEAVSGVLLGQLASLEHIGPRFYNCYGPTETSLCATCIQIPYAGPHISGFSESISVGCPLPGYSIYVVDRDMRPVPVGIQGEIYIGGLGVGGGYINQPSLTAEKFVPDIFATPDEHEKGWTTLHRTGDVGRWQENGTLLVEGRIIGDNQVKLRGLRIDLGEVERGVALAAEGIVAETVVTTRRSSPSSPEFLVAHVVLRQRHGVNTPSNNDVNLINERLTTYLPQYMCPAAIIPIPSLPKTNSAKIDRRAVKALPLPEITEIPTTGNMEIIDAMTDLEKRVKVIWQEVISSPISSLHGPIIAETDFFQIGGNSLLLLGLQKKIRETFSVEIPIIRMFGCSKLGDMASWIYNHNKQPNQILDTTTQSPTLIDWEEETSLPPALLDTVPPRPKELGDLRVVIITGATGSLGRSILEALIAHPQIERVHCIAVRSVVGRHDILNSEKIFLHEGDLAFPRLGLPEETAEHIFSEADAIIHNGADMSYAKTYDSLRACNLQSTKELARMSSRYRIPFHYISTLSVGHVIADAKAATNVVDVRHQDDGKDERFVFGPVSVAAYTPVNVPSTANRSVNVAQGYIASKWASERFLERIHERFSDWPIYIHRPSLIAREETEAAGSNESPGLALVQNVRHFASLLRAVPVVPGGRVKGSFNLVSSGVVVKGIMDALAESREPGGVRFLHYVGEIELPLDDPRKWALEDTRDGQRGEAEELSLGDWTRRARDLGMHAAMAAMLEDFGAASGGIAVPRVAGGRG
ncbi:uncharacterized protein GGS22DRAFT_194555 [Annulohypoxylon maeteangense]|uniref:uncharacterized protein n=1 Tax=Annulohypoxylon maeteangense TaxID=1927788 RepID=UPI002008AB92|nr:uncharacterized protein GGS22DRAFT_194555 [Annulohypoxylon maeteangense]KAI0890579.1 hypothetical protein GGS22DRAFT_194555 [Annulohypoxylon maeteangense]